MSILFDCIYAIVNNNGKSAQLLHRDTSNAFMGPSKLKPDFVFALAGTNALEWSNVAAVCELKAINRGDENQVLGQIYSYFNSMWQTQPRRHCIGLYSFKEELHLLVNTRGKIDHVPVGTLPFVNPATKSVYSKNESEQMTFETNNGKAVVQTLAMVFMLSHKQCGFLAPQPRGVYGDCFGLRRLEQSDSQGKAMLSVVVGAKEHADCMVQLSGSGYLGGRVLFPIGTTSWVHRANIALCSGDQPSKPEAVVKIQWRRSSRRSEQYIYELLHEMGVPNIPQVLFGGEIACSPECAAANCDILILEECGIGISKYISKLCSGSEHNRWMLLDVVCGYLHTIYAAWSGNEKRVLHRDISSGNLMVLANSARVIDWEFGLFLDAQESRTSVSSNPLTGTMVYASLDVLSEKSSRSPMDDVESLFYVLAHGIEKAHRSERITGNSSGLWDAHATIEQLLDERRKWFVSKQKFFTRIDRNCPALWMGLLGALYDVLQIDTQITQMEGFASKVSIKQTVEELLYKIMGLLGANLLAASHYGRLKGFHSSNIF
ncbi:hypothetical protein EV177_003980 [Coemansia sp. RSA 1804]|nr:hypothetical protein EV177_003980 [Coemansia sp. RSA 1804]